MRSVGRISTEIEVEVQFSEVDTMRVVWHGHYLRYLEAARWALMNQIGYGLEAMITSGVAWPIVDVHMRHLQSARFAQRLRVRASLIDWTDRLVVNYLITDAASGKRILRASTTQVAVDVASGEMQYGTPPQLAARIGEALA